MRILGARVAVALAVCVGAVSAGAGDAELAPHDSLRIGRARLALYHTLLDLQTRYLECTIPAAAYGPEVVYYLARCRLLAGARPQALAALARPLIPARADAALYDALLALVGRAAAGELDPSTGGADGATGLPVSDQLRLAAEHAFFVAAVGGYPNEGAALAREVQARAAREGLPLVASVRRCLAYCALRSGDMASGRVHLARLLPLEPELRIQIEEFSGGEDGRTLATEVACYAPDVLLAHALSALGPARAAAEDPVDRVRAALAAGDRADATGLAPTSPWRVALAVRDLALASEPALVAPLRGDPSRRALLDAARAIEEVLGQADLALPLRQRALLLLRERGVVLPDGTLVETPPLHMPGEVSPTRLVSLAPARFVELAALEVGELASCALDALDPATRERAVALHDELFAHGRRGNLWEFDATFLARLARSFVEAGRYDALTGYLFRRPTVPELEVCAAAARTMARELEAYSALSRQAGAPRAAAGAPVAGLERLLFGAVDPGEEYLPRPTPPVDLGTRTPASVAAEGAAPWQSQVAFVASGWVTNPWLVALAGVALVLGVVRALRRRRILARYNF